MVSLAPSGEAHVKVVMGLGATLEGRVLDNRRQPLGHVRVDLAAAKGTLERTTLTAEDGSFAFAAVPREVVISVSRPDAMDDVAVRTTVPVKEGERKEIGIVLPAPREATTVSVVTERGDAVEAAQVLLVSLSPEAPLKRTLFTDRQGRAVFRDSVGLPVRITVSARGRASVTRQLDVAPAEQRIELTRGARVLGSVTTRGGREALPGAHVTLVAAGGSLYAETDREGAFQFADATSGEARLTVTHAGYAKFDRSSTWAPATASVPFLSRPPTSNRGGASRARWSMRAAIASRGRVSPKGRSPPICPRGSSLRGWC